MMGREVMQPLNLMLLKLNKENVSVPGFAEEYQRAQEKAYALARATLKQGLRRQKKDYDTKLNHTVFDVGDIVLRVRNAMEIGISKKLQEGSVCGDRSAVPGIVPNERQKEIISYSSRQAEVVLR